MRQIYKNYFRLSNTLIVIISLLLLSSCSNVSTDENKDSLQRRSLREYFQGAGVERYFLPGLPSWANYSISGNCKRTTSKRFLNFKKIRDSFSLSYLESLHIQYLYNIDLERIKKEKKVDSLRFEDEERLFFSVTDRIQSDILGFKKPTFKKVNLIWLDPYYTKELPLAKLKSLLKSSRMNKGFPVFISSCMSYVESERFIEKVNDQNFKVLYLSYEMLTPFDKDNKLLNKQVFSIRHLLGDKKDITLFIPKDFDLGEVSLNIERFFY